MAQLHNGVFSSAWVMVCIMASFFMLGTADAKGSSAEAAPEPHDVQAILGRAWSQASEIAASASENMSGYVESKGAWLQMFGVGALGAGVLACTLYVISRVMDKEPFLFNGGKLGRLEAQSVYVKQKKAC